MKIGQQGVFAGYEDRPGEAVEVLTRGDACVVLEIPDEDTVRVCCLTHDGALIRDVSELLFRSEFIALNNTPLIVAAYSNP
jgi:hypothetical protein